MIGPVDPAFLRFERHALGCGNCAPVYARQLAWDGRSSKPGPLCSDGDGLWCAYLLPDVRMSQPRSDCGGSPTSDGSDEALAAMPEELAAMLARCTRCPKRLADDGYATCAPCRVSAKRYETDKRAKCRQIGLCPRCSEPPEDGHAMCGKCREAGTRWKRILHAKRRKEGACVKCGGERDRDGDGWCASCRSWASSNYRAIKAKGICLKCRGNAEPTRARCAGCRANDAAKRKAFRQRMRADGVCYGCGKDKPIEGSARCRRCIDATNERSRAYAAARAAGVQRYDGHGARAESGASP